MCIIVLGRGASSRELSIAIIRHFHELSMSVHRARHAVGYVFMLLGCLIGAWASRIPDVKTAIGVEESGFGLVLLVMAFGAILGFPISGRLVDRFGAARVSKVFAVANLIAFALIPTGLSAFATLLPIVFLTGFCIGTLDVAMNGWGAEVETALARPVMSSYHGLFSLGAGLGALAGVPAIQLELSVLQHLSGWSLVLFLPLVFSLSTPWMSERVSSNGEKSPFFAIPRGALLWVGIMALVAALGEAAVIDWAALYQIDELGFESSQAVIGFAVFSAAMVVMRLTADRLILRFGSVQVARVSGLAACLGAALLVWGAELWIVWIGCAVMGLGNAAIFPLAMSRAAAEQSMSKGAALAAVATLGYGSFLLGPPILGFIGEAVSLRASFALVALLALLITLLAGSLKITPEPGAGRHRDR